MLRRTISLVICAACAACQLANGWGQARADPPPVVLFVQQPQAQVAAATVGAAFLTPPPQTADGSESRPFPSLRTALRLAPAGALLRIGDGIWREQLLISRPVVLLGRGAGRTRILPPAGTRVAVEVRADHVQLYGLSIEDATVGIEFAGGAGHRLENVALRHLAERIPPSLLLIHFLVGCPAEDNKRKDDEKPANQGSGRKRFVKIGRQKLIYDGDDEDCEEGGNG